MTDEVVGQTDPAPLEASCSQGSSIGHPRLGEESRSEHIEVPFRSVIRAAACKRCSYDLKSTR